jgi:phage terminase large subunit
LTTSVRLSDLIAPSFFELHRRLKTESPSEIWAKGGRGSTKSSWISIEILLMLSQDKDAHAFVSRRYDNELRDSVFGQLQWAAHKLGIDHLWRFMVSPMQAVNVKTCQKIIFRGLDNPLKAKSINLGKGYVKIFWGEEVDQYSGMQEIRSILQSVFRGEGKNKIAFFSFNPPKSARSWVNAECRVPKDGRIVHHSDYTTVNPIWLGERFIADAMHLKSVNESAYRHEYLGEEVGTGLEVFNNVTVRPILPSERDCFGQVAQGIDFGYAVDPVSFERMYYDAKKRMLWIFNEISGIGVSNRMLAEKMSQEEKRTLTYADAAEPKSIEELRSDYGLNVRACKKGPGSVETGIKWLADIEQIIIDPVTCPLASREFVNYALEINRNGDVISRYPDKDNHTIDATRYACGDFIGVRHAKVPNSNIRGAMGI